MRVHADDRGILLLLAARPRRTNQVQRVELNRVAQWAADQEPDPAAIGTTKQGHESSGKIGKDSSVITEDNPAVL